MCLDDLSSRGDEPSSQDRSATMSTAVQMVVFRKLTALGRAIRPMAPSLL